MLCKRQSALRRPSGEELTSRALSSRLRLVSMLWAQLGATQATAGSPHVPSCLPSRAGALGPWILTLLRTPPHPSHWQAGKGGVCPLGSGARAGATLGGPARKDRAGRKLQKKGKLMPSGPWGPSGETEAGERKGLA